MGSRDMREKICLLLAVALGLQGLVGLTAAFGYSSTLWRWHAESLARALYDAPKLPADAWPIAEQLVAMLGGTIVAWSVAMIALVLGPLRRGEPGAGRVLAASTLAWYAIDSGASLRHGALENVVFNTVALAMVVTPLLALKWASRRSAP